MDFMIFDSAGNAVEAFGRDQVAAAKALVAMVREDPDASRHLAILAFDEHGEAVGEPVTIADILPEMASTVMLVGAWSHRNALTFVSERVVAGARESRKAVTEGTPPGRSSLTDLPRYPLVG